MTQLPNDSAPRRASNDDIWALFLGLAVVGLALLLVPRLRSVTILR